MQFNWQAVAAAASLLLVEHLHRSTQLEGA
jgi:hypothetical protein